MMQKSLFEMSKSYREKKQVNANACTDHISATQFELNELCRFN